MGYDMYWVEDGTNIDAVVNNSGSYFRLNIWGMGDFRIAMARCNMIHSKMRDVPEWPLAPEDDSDEAYNAYEEAADKVRRASVEYPGIPAHKLGSNEGWIVTPIEALSAVKMWEDAGCPTYMRIMSQDFPVESSWGPIPPVDDPSTALDEVWDRWVEWIRESAAHGGFKVW